MEGGGVCGAIFLEAGSVELTKACNSIGGCKTGNAVITPGFNLTAKYVIHAVGPRWFDGKHNEPKLLYSAYKQSLLIAKENGLHSIGFPLISAGIFGYPLDGAWRKAIQACNDFICNNLDYDIKVIFAVLDDKILTAGEKFIKDIVVDEKVKDNPIYIDAYVDLNTLFRKNSNQLIVSQDETDEDTITEIEGKIRDLNETIGSLSGVKAFEDNVTPEYKKFKNEDIEVSVKSEIAIKEVNNLVKLSDY